MLCIQVWKENLEHLECNLDLLKAVITGNKTLVSEYDYKNRRLYIKSPKYIVLVSAGVGTSKWCQCQQNFPHNCFFKI